MKIFIPLFAILLLVSCSYTTGDIRKNQPTTVKSYDGDYKAIANCVAEKMDEAFDLAVNLRVVESKKYARVFMANPETGNTLCDFLFKQDESNGKVLVESRGMWGMSGLPNQILPFVDQCAAGE